MYFLENDIELENYFRAIILFGRNVASYKFALAKSLLELDCSKDSFVSLDDLSKVFSKHIVEHVKSGNRQTTSRSSKFLYACQLYSENKISDDELYDITKKYGFNNVIDAFHNVDSHEKKDSFYEKTIRNNKKGIIVTDNLYNLRESNDLDKLEKEIEGRWNLVETSWEQRNPNMIIEYEPEDMSLFTLRQQSNSSYLDSHLRVKVTDSRYPLSGYQKGKCFYCYDEITHLPNQKNTCDVDHFFPISMQSKFNSNLHLNLNGIWNLVLSCPECNRGEKKGKFAHTPALHLLERLERRNNYYIYSKHPLGDTIMKLTGNTVQERRRYLSKIHELAKKISKFEWTPAEVKGNKF
jgi:5-methylcytosine-specific restriction endonuclease McrA